jgi:hypothetical protein
VGQSALSLNNLSSYNTAVGYEALKNAETANTNGNQGHNTALGYQAGQYATPLTTGYQNTFIGSLSYSTANNVYNSTAIGYNAIVSTNNMMQLGNTSVTLVNTSGVLKTVNTTAATSISTGALQVPSGGASIGGALWVGGLANIAGAITVTGIQTFTGATTHNSTVQFNDHITLVNGKTLSVGTSGATTPLELYGTLTVAGASTFNNSVSVSGANTFTVGTGATNLGGTLTVSGVTQLNGLVYAPTPAIGDATTRVATVGYVQDAMLNTNQGWTADGNTGMSTYSLYTARDMMSYGELASGNLNTNSYQSWTPALGFTSYSDKFLGTIDGNPLVFRVNRNRAGRMDFDLNLGQASYGYGAAKNTWLNASGYTADGNPLRNYMGTKNTAFGYEALTNTNIGKENVAVGYRALQYNQSYNGMVAIGFESMSNFTDAFTAGGYQQGHTLLQQSQNAYSTDGFNTAIGYQSLKGSATVSNNTGLYNTAIGYQSITGNTNGSNNTALGYQTLKTNTSGGRNVAVGQSALSLNSTGNNSTAIGFEALKNATGSNNTTIGYQAGLNITSGSNNLLLGYNAQPSSATVSNEITLGNNSNGVIRANVSTITSLSDARDKKNINDLELGLDFVNALKPRVFNWDKREWYADNKSDGTKTSNNLTAGFIAQELDATQNKYKADWLNLVYKTSPDKWEATYGNLLPVVVKSIQELNALNTKTQTDLNTKLSYTTTSQLTLGNENVKEVVTNASLTVGESLSVKHLKGNSSTPGIQASTGAGNSASVKITGTDMSGVIEVATGEMPTANAILATIQYSTAYGTAPVVIITPGNAATASLMGTSTVFVGSNTSTDFTLNTNATPLVSKTTYKWYYQVIQ